MVQDSNI